MDSHEEFRRIALGKRVYASMREGGTHGQKELSALRDLLESMDRAGQQLYCDPRLSAVDPPDCIARAAHGGLVAFEVTEFVSQLAVELNERARPARGQRPALATMVQARWERPGFLDRIRTILAEKDSKSFKGGPFGETIVLIHTDERLLIRSQCDAWLSDQAFGPFRQLTSAFLLYPYEPGVGYPFQAISLAAA